MANIRFKNLPSLLNDMEKKKWIIDSFFFQYKDEKYIVILKLYKKIIKESLQSMQRQKLNLLEELMKMNQLQDILIFMKYIFIIWINFVIFLA